MTIQYVVNQLIVHFCTKDTFRLDDVESINVEQGLREDHFDIVVAALDELEEKGIVKQVVLGDEPPLWMLTRPMQGVGQDVGLSIQTCILIRDTIEAFHKANGMPYENIDPFMLHEGHIRRLLEIVGDVLDKGPPTP